AHIAALPADASLDAVAVSFHDVLMTRLKTMTPAELCAFDEAHDDAHGRLYHWPLWAAGYLIGGGCSDDAFMDFRNGLIALGREWCERLLADADSLAGHPLVVAAAAREDEVLFCEELAYAPAYAFEATTGLPRDEYWALYERHREGKPVHRASPTGPDFDFDDRAEMLVHLPRLTTLFWPED
ncbi:MAG TPA: DUF4240 domain-containing protein, partial [Phytomonospora sp.]